METTQNSGRPLEGIRVVDLTTVVLGPYASQLLADYGADVIKIEPPAGDSTRRTGHAAEPGMAAGFIGVNRNKRSVVLDIKKPEHKEALLALIDGADVFMHNIRPQKLKGLGLDSETLMARNPRLIYVGLHGFGEDGPYAGKPAYDDIIQGLSGMAALGQMRDGSPSFVPSVVADKTCGIYAAMAISMALVGRAKNGQGHYVEVPMFESMAGFTLVEHMSGNHFHPPVGGLGYARLLTEWRKPYQTSDGYICAVPYTDRHWEAFFRACGMSELAEDDRFRGIAARTRNIDTLYKLLGEAIASKSTSYWLETLTELDVPCSRLNTLSDLWTDPHLQQTGFFRDVPDADMEKIQLTDAPVRFNRTRVPFTAPPRLGQHTEEVLGEIGIQLKN